MGESSVKLFCKVVLLFIVRFMESNNFNVLSGTNLYTSRKRKWNVEIEVLKCERCEIGKREEIGNCLYARCVKGESES